MSSATSKTQVDIELGHYRDGYPALAAWMNRDPDHETYVFRRFHRLGARSILHSQSRLIALEKEIDDLDDEARKSDDFEARQSSRRYETLIRHSEDPNRSENKRLEKLEELKRRLKEYCKRLKVFTYTVLGITYHNRRNAPTPISNSRTQGTQHPRPRHLPGLRTRSSIRVHQ